MLIRILVLVGLSQLILVIVVFFCVTVHQISPRNGFRLAVVYV